MMSFYSSLRDVNTFTAIDNLSRFNNSCLKLPVSTLVDIILIVDIVIAHDGDEPLKDYISEFLICTYIICDKESFVREVMCA